MAAELKLSPALQARLRCPVCGDRLRLESAEFRCTNADCALPYPVVDGVPVLINEANSVFRIRDFVQRRDTFFPHPPSRLQRFLDRITPDINLNVNTAQHSAAFANALPATNGQASVLVVGCGDKGEGMGGLGRNPAIELTSTDVSLGPTVQAVCDAHDLPFEDGSFDGLIAQAVLEHVVDPYRCVAEFHRVLKPDGVVYAETPFMQQVHGGRYDFTRFTHLGHRRLFRTFEEIDSGAVCGPGMALAWSWLYFLRSFARTRVTRRLLTLFGSLTSFYFKYFDRALVGRPAALDAASGLYFIGRRSEQVLSDQDLIRLYRGA